MKSSNVWLERGVHTPSSLSQLAPIPTLCGVQSPKTPFLSLRSITTTGDHRRVPQQPVICIHGASDSVCCALMSHSNPEGWGSLLLPHDVGMALGSKTFKNMEGMVWVYLLWGGCSGTPSRVRPVSAPPPHQAGVGDLTPCVSPPEDPQFDAHQPGPGAPE